MARKPAKLSKRWNADGSITLYCRGRKVERFTGSSASESVKHFAAGWYGDHPIRWGKSKFAKSKKGTEE
ncbi:hypothetical protein RCCWILLIS_88 [Rhodobacter phage RcCWillis]|nr:hypothetical protein RCCWILLIS_88 [Rhodobacter phage RcCWillis]